MALHHIKKGLDLPIEGAPAQRVDPVQVRSVALVGPDYVGLQPQIQASVGDWVKRGQLLFADKKNPGVRFTAPAAGRITAINRGAQRSFQSLVIELSEAELSGEASEAEQVGFAAFRSTTPSSLDAEAVRALLLESGLWTALRTRPLGKIPPPQAVPHSIFITAIDTNPLAADPAVVLPKMDGLQAGLEILGKLTNGRLFFCQAAGAHLPVTAGGRVQIEEFAGPHPAGLPGLHIHLLDPVSRAKTVWYINYQDVCAIGQLFLHGKVAVDRIISLAGPAVVNPRLLQSRLGASLADLSANELAVGENRLISGPVLSGRSAVGSLAYLGRYHLQLAALREGREREFMGWLVPGWNKFSISRAFLSALRPKARVFPFSTSTNGSVRAIVPIGVYEKVMPLDLEPTYLLRSLVINDLDSVEKLGGLELEEEDLALCTFVCPSKIDYGPLLRRTLTEFAQELT